MIDGKNETNQTEMQQDVEGVHFLDSSPSLFISQQASRVQMPKGGCTMLKATLPEVDIVLGHMSVVQYFLLVLL